MKHIFLLGKEGNNYYNSFVYSIVDSLLSCANNDIFIYVSNLCKKGFYMKNISNVTPFYVSIPNICGIKYLLYDFISLNWAIRKASNNPGDTHTILLFSTRIGIFLPLFRHRLKKFNISLHIYCEDTNSHFDNFAIISGRLQKLSELYCVKYANSLVFGDVFAKKYFKSFYLDIPFKSHLLNCSFDTFIGALDAFFDEHDFRPYNYYLLIDESCAFGNISSIIQSFLQCHTQKKLLILSRKDTHSYKSLVLCNNFSSNSKIKFLNIKRFMHLIPNLTRYCYGYIHSNIKGLDEAFLKSKLYDNVLNIVLDSPINRRYQLNNVLYYTWDSFIDAINEAESLSIEKEPPNSKDSFNQLSILIDTLFTL